MPERRTSTFLTSARDVQRLYFRVVQVTVMLVVALHFFVNVVYGVPPKVSTPLVALYGALILLSWYGSIGGAPDEEGSSKPWGLLFGVIGILVALLCAETGGLASPFVLLLLATSVFGALILSPHSAIALTLAVSGTYLTTTWLYRDSEVGLLAGGHAGLVEAATNLRRMPPAELSALVVQCGFFWLGTLVSLRVAEGFRRRVGDAESAALLDPLTQLPNRRGFREKLRLEADRIAQWNWSVALLAVDLDHFKRVNDEMDHQVGDLALTHAARILREVAGPLDHVARVGGEEFAIAAVGSDRRQAQDLAERICRAFRRHDWTAVAPDLWTLTCSIGVSFRAPTRQPGRYVDFAAMTQEADHAMLLRKRHGRDGYVMADVGLPIAERGSQAPIRRTSADGPVQRPRFIRR